MGHDCNQSQKFNQIEVMVKEVKIDLDEHRKAQQIQDKEREVRLEERKVKDQELTNHLNEISGQIQELLILNGEVNDFKTAWKVGKNLGLGLAAFITFLGIVFGGALALKGWLKS